MAAQLHGRVTSDASRVDTAPHGRGVARDRALLATGTAVAFTSSQIMSPHDFPANEASLKREVPRPSTRTRVFAQLLVLATVPMLAGMASLWAGAILAPAPEQVPNQVIIQLEYPVAAALPGAVAQRATAPTPVAQAPAAPLEPGFAFVLEVGDRVYMHLKDMDAVNLAERTDEDEDDMEDEDARPARAPLPRHAPPKVIRADGLPVAAVAAVQASDLSPDISAWQGREVLVNGTCRARVTGFALVARVYAEDLAYQEEEQKMSAAELARTIFDHMGHLVLAATLDGCKGSYAQPADGPAAIPARVLAAHPAQAAAAAKLRQSKVARAAQKTWRENDYEGAWWSEAEVRTQILQHPGTEEIFVSVHAMADVECGGLEINLWGLYRVAADGKLEPLAERTLDNVSALETFLDIDGDGRFELLARSLWGLDTFLLDADGSRRAILHIPFYGCQC